MLPFRRYFSPRFRRTLSYSVFVNALKNFLGFLNFLYTNLLQFLKDPFLFDPFKNFSYSIRPFENPGDPRHRRHRLLQHLLFSPVFF